MAKKTASKKSAPLKSKSKKMAYKAPKGVAKPLTRGDTPIIIDDGGSTRIRHLDKLMDSLLSSGSATINSQVAAAKIRYIDDSGNTSTIKIPAAAATITVTTSTVSVTVAMGATTTITLGLGVTATAKDDSNSTQRSYVCNDSSGIENISASDAGGGLLLSADTISDTVFTLLHLRFPQIALKKRR